VFSAIDKFDGVASRMLNATEVRQIAGRAGRYGIYPTGYVSTFEDDELVHIEHMLSTSDVATLTKLPISLNAFHIETLSQMLNTERIGELLEFFANSIAVDSPLFQIASMQGQVTQGHLIEAHAPSLSLQDKFTFACAPVSLDKTHERDYFVSCLISYALGKQKRLPAETYWLDSTSPQHLEQAEDLSKDLSLYAWLAFKFPDTFNQSHLLTALRARVSRYIERALLRQAGFNDTSKELMYYSERR